MELVLLPCSISNHCRFFPKQEAALFPALTIDSVHVGVVFFLCDFLHIPKMSAPMVSQKRRGSPLPLPSACSLFILILLQVQILFTLKYQRFQAPLDQIQPRPSPLGYSVARYMHQENCPGFLTPSPSICKQGVQPDIISQSPWCFAAAHFVGSWLR